MATIEQLYQRYSRRVQAELIRLFGDFSLAEEASQEAFAAALKQWPESGEPDNPLAWLIRTGYRRGIDQIRRNGNARRHAHLITTPDAKAVRLPTLIPVARPFAEVTPWPIYCPMEKYLACVNAAA